MATAQPLASKLPGSVQISKDAFPNAASNPDEMIRRAYSEKIYANDKTRLTWNPDKPPMVPDDRIVGEVNCNLPYIFIERTIYYQNSKFYLSNGEPTSLGYISQRHPLLYNQCVRVKELMDADAARRDPLLCKHCFSYRALDPDDYHEHIVNFHTDAVLSTLRSDSAKPAATAAPPDAPSIHAAQPALFPCPDCGKKCRTRMALGSHKRVHKQIEAS
jgi:hypothetical protein